MASESPNELQRLSCKNIANNVYLARCKIRTFILQDARSGRLSCKILQDNRPILIGDASENPIMKNSLKNLALNFQIEFFLTFNSVFVFSH